MFWICSQSLCAGPGEVDEGGPGEDGGWVNLYGYVRRIRQNRAVIILEVRR